MLDDKRVRIVSGHYGSGKTEFTINYGIKLASLDKKVVIVDLDVVNPYFRSREKEKLLEENNVKVIGSSIKATSLDIPSISSEISSFLKNETYEIIIDLGGNPEGARALGRYYEDLKEIDYDFFFVLNANRPETQTVECVIDFIERIQDVARAKITGIVNNTHLLKSTSLDDIMKGYYLSRKVSKLTRIPIIYNSGLEPVLKSIQDKLEGELFSMRIYMREEWMV